MDDSEIIFVDRPSYDVKCPICFELFKDPHQVLCCGNHICKHCLDQNKLACCPLCREKKVNAVPDKFFYRQLLCMKVECYNSVKGCPWTGELRMLEDHVEKSCSKNIITCKHCASEFSRNAFKEHTQECDQIPQPCPCNCSPVRIERRFLKHHLDSECPFRVIDDAPVPHAANSKERQIPLTLAMTNYSQFVQTGYTWYSSPFYTHNSGYKLLLQIDIKTSHQLSVLVCILKGEHDHKLLWPLRASIEVGVYNWRTKTSVFKRVLYLKGDFFCTRSTSDLPPSWGNGLADFIHCDKLGLELARNTNIIRHNCLIFCVEKITLLKALPVPVFPKWAEGRVFAVPGFTLMKNKTPYTAFSCPPIYTGKDKDGYKLCLQAYFGGSHASVCFFLMKGEVDHKLPWPLEADVTIEMLNWKEDQNHMKHTFCFDYRCQPEQISKVLINSSAPQGQSFNFAALSSLPLNLSKNTQYLNQDCLLFRVSSVTAYVDKKSFSKLPGWVDPLKGSLYPCFTLPEFKNRRNQGNCWFSHSFFSHQDGYKMKLEIRASRNQKVSLFLYMMKGPYDDCLQWPFSGDIILELVNWQSDSSHHRKTLCLNSSVSNTTCERVIGRERGADGLGYPDFISHDLLLQSSATVTYLQNDCLHFRVKEVIVHSIPAAARPPPWFSRIPANCRFMVTNFTKRKEFNSTYYSPAFYSHSGGYKMMVKIDPNSNSHISVMVRILKGENDSYLKWPFCGNIVIELTNFVRNGDHIEHNINLHERIIKECTGKVGDTENQYWGFPEATSHAALQYNKCRNIQFLRNDCICIRVKRVASYTHDLIVPRWQNPRAPASFTVNNVPDRIEMKSTYYSPPFFVDMYKMCMKITFDGYKPSERVKYLSFYACLLKGDNDDALLWPFCGDLTVEILNWHDDHGHYKGIVSLDYPDHYTHARVLNEQVEPSGYGKEFFISISALFSQFLNERCMRVRVSHADVYNTPPRLKNTHLQANMQSKYGFEFTINNVSTRMRNLSMFRSAPFYTHENGYKMRLEIYLGGDENDRGYLSIYARLLAGENDSALKWPMNVALKIEVLNWFSNSFHITRKIEMGGGDRKSRGQVTPDNISAENSFGFGMFCTRETLYQRSLIVLYVNEDYIRVRVNKALILSHNKKFLN